MIHTLSMAWQALKNACASMIDVAECNEPAAGRYTPRPEPTHKPTARRTKKRAAKASQKRNRK